MFLTDLSESGASSNSPKLIEQNSYSSGLANPGNLLDNEDVSSSLDSDVAELTEAIVTFSTIITILTSESVS